MGFSILSSSSVFVYSFSVELLDMNPDSSDGAPPKGELQSESGFRYNSQVGVNVTPGEGVEPPAHLVLCLHEISGIISEDLGKVAKNADVAAYSSHKGSGSVVFYDFNIEMACYKAGDQKYPAFLAP